MLAEGENRSSSEVLDEAGFLRLVRGETRGMLAMAARGGLACASAGYRMGVSGRNLAYDREAGKQSRKPRCR